ncbi:ComEC/Rec2 family competence protein [Fodinicola acaciae]|uniref:ComEC/Rec2 family competence protein n=1 Tax=Fodinicola acaciae TaxID=2681555 RepID=UPI0013D7D020|nr:ComEC/Rec2 family competence protein [Fodinicola acaciae]
MTEHDGLDLRLAAVGAGIWAAALAGLLTSPPVALAIAVVGAVVFVAAMCGKAHWLGVLAAAALGVAGGGLTTSVQLLPRDTGPIPVLAADRAEVSVVGTVQDDPRPIRSAAAPSYLVPIGVSELRTSGRRLALGASVLVFGADRRWLGLLPGQRLRVSGRLGPPGSVAVTAATLTAAGPPTLIGAPPYVQTAAGGLRAGLRQACDPLPDPQGGLLPGLVVGDTSTLDPQVAEDFRLTGMTHLTAVSGSNCAIVSGVVLLLCRRLRARPTVAAVCAAVALAGFVVLARPSPSVLRAAVMGGLALVALASGRPRSALPALCATIGLLILLDAGQAASAGFVLSVLATAGLLVVAPGWRDALRSRRVPAGIAEGIAVPAAAQLACAPVIAGMSGTVGLVAVPANLLAVPAVAPATVLGVLAALVSPVAPPVAAVLAWCASWPALWLVTIADIGANIPGGVLPWPSGLSGALLLLVVLLVVLAAGRIAWIRRAAAAVIVVVILVVVPIRVVAPGWPPVGWQLVGCAVGQGDAIVLRVAALTAVVIDTGPEPVAVDGCLRRLDIQVIPVLLLSHLHADHVGGIEGAVRGRQVGVVLVGRYRLPGTGEQTLETAVSRHHLRVVTVQPGDQYQVGPVGLRVLGPSATIRGTRSDPNNNSLMVLADLAGTTVLLPGDAEREEEDAILSAGAAVRADVLKVPHHGSMYSDPRFIDTVAPAVAIVEVGLGNDYGHPSPGVLLHLRRIGAQVWRTDLDGDVAVVRQDGRLAGVARGTDPVARSP